jgi:hypothetical protein
MSEPLHATESFSPEPTATVAGTVPDATATAPGNPFVHLRAARYQAFLDAVSVEEIHIIADKLLAMAKQGNLAAAKLVFLYAIGKPMPADQLDNLDTQPWEHPKSTAHQIMELARAMAPGLELPVPTSGHIHKPVQQSSPPLDPFAGATLAEDVAVLGFQSGGQRPPATSGNTPQTILHEPLSLCLIG